MKTKKAKNTTELSQKEEKSSNIAGKVVGGVVVGAVSGFAGWKIAKYIGSKKLEKRKEEVKTDINKAIEQMRDSIEANIKNRVMVADVQGEAYKMLNEIINEFKFDFFITEEAESISDVDFAYSLMIENQRLVADKFEDAIKKIETGDNGYAVLQRLRSSLTKELEIDLDEISIEPAAKSSWMAPEEGDYEVADESAENVNEVICDDEVLHEQTDTDDDEETRASEEAGEYETADESVGTNVDVKSNVDFKWMMHISEELEEEVGLLKEDLTLLNLDGMVAFSVVAAFVDLETRIDFPGLKTYILEGINRSDLLVSEIIGTSLGDDIDNQDTNNEIYDKILSVVNDANSDREVITGIVSMVLESDHVVNISENPLKDMPTSILEIVLLTDAERTILQALGETTDIDPTKITPLGAVMMKMSRVSTVNTYNESERLINDIKKDIHGSIA